VSSALREGGVLFIQVYNDRAKAGFHYTQSFRTLSFLGIEEMLKMGG
jgi:hypothetical protein